MSPTFFQVLLRVFPKNSGWQGTLCTRQCRQISFSAKDNLNRSLWVQKTIYTDFFKRTRQFRQFCASTNHDESEQENLDSFWRFWRYLMYTLSVLYMDIKALTCANLSAKEQENSMFCVFLSLVFMAHRIAVMGNPSFSLSIFTFLSATTTFESDLSWATYTWSIATDTQEPRCHGWRCGVYPAKSSRLLFPKTRPTECTKRRPKKRQRA